MADDDAPRLVPKPSMAEGWYESNNGRGYTCDPKYAKMVPVCRVCDEYHREPEGTCLL